MMVSLRRTEGFALAAEFETKDGYRGYRMFTLFLEIENLSSVITEIRQWQTPAQLTFKSEYNAWSKKVIYKTLRETTMNSLLTTELGADKTKSFIIEINAKIAKFGYKIGLIEAGSVYIDLVSRDLLEAQEAPQKAQYILTTAKVTAQTKEVNANADAKVITIAATAEATKVTTIGAATNTVLANRIKILKDLYDYQKDLIVAKYGSKGLENLRVYIEGNGQGTSSDIQKMIDTLVAFDIHEEKKEV
jgi:hypothetical protein